MFIIIPKNNNKNIVILISPPLSPYNGCKEGNRSRTRIINIILQLMYLFGNRNRKRKLVTKKSIKRMSRIPRHPRQLLQYTQREKKIYINKTKRKDKNRNSKQTHKVRQRLRRVQKMKRYKKDAGEYRQRYPDR